MREAVFDCLRAWIPGRRVLDLFAGTGAFGLEALSNGAATVVFVDSDPSAVAAIEKNIRTLGVGSRTAVVRARVDRAIQTLEGPFDLIIADPPYGDPDCDAEILARAAELLLAPAGRIVIEHSSRTQAPEIPGLVVQRSHRYGRTAITIYGTHP